MQQHSITTCPQRSMAWITVNQGNTVVRATTDMIKLLGFDPVGQSIDAVWTIKDNQLATTVESNKTLYICQHPKDEENTIVCTDMTDLNHMYTTSRQKYNQVAITRLTMYGTIDAVFQSQTHPALSIGQPIMRYIHSDDLEQFCAGLNEATKFESIARFSLRLVSDDSTVEYNTEFTVMPIEGGKVLCLMRPQQQQHEIAIETEHCSSVLRETVTHMQHNFWYALERGMTLLAHNLATSLMIAIQTIWCLWHETNQSDKKGWTGLFATSSEYVLRKMVKCTKERPEVDKICYLVSWMGISKSTSRTWFDNTLDQTSEWLIAKTFADNICDSII